MFKKKRGIKVAYNLQGLIYFTCVNYKNLGGDMQEYIKSLCMEVTKEHHKALFTFLTDDHYNGTGISAKFALSETQLYYYRKRFYEKWDLKKITC